MRKKLLIVIFITIFSNFLYAQGSDEVQLICEYENTDSYSSGKVVIDFMFELVPSEQRIYYLLNSDSKIELTKLFWNEDFIGAVEFSKDYTFLGPSISSYLFDRRAGELLWNHIRFEDFDRDRRQDLHSIVRMTGAISPLLFTCSLVGGIRF